MAPQSPRNRRSTSTTPGETSDPSLARRARYQFDLTLSKGTGALIIWLGLVTAVFVVLTGVILHLVTPGTATSLVESAWDALMHTIDSGTVTADSGWGYRLIALGITLVGIFILSTLIGLIASLIDRTIENLRKGRGIVVERNHTIILGWSEKLHTIISELKAANTNQAESCIVVMAPHDRVAMEDEINARFGGSLALELITGRAALGVARGLLRRRSAGQTRIVCRTGNPADPADLAITSPLTARSVIVLSDGGEHADANAVKVLLALMSFDRDLSGVNVTIELVNDDNAEAIREASGGAVQTVVSSTLISSLTAQICRQAGMGAVFQELLDFAGDEIYFAAPGRLAGATYGQALLSFNTSSVIGVRRADGACVLNPSMDFTISADDALIVISEDDDTIAVTSIDTWRPDGTLMRAAPASIAPDHLLVIGWNANAPHMLVHLDAAAAPGSTVDVVVDPAIVRVDIADLGVVPFTNIAVNMLEADTTRVAPLAQILAARDYERLVLLGYRDHLSSAEADARTLLTLVHTRRLLVDDHRNRSSSIVAELLDARSVKLGQVANPDDFVVSERLTSLLLAQLAENRELASVFDELLDGVGHEIAMRPLAPYVADASDADASGADAGVVVYADVVRAARKRGESALGFMVVGTSTATGVAINPHKASTVPAGADTHVIVLA